MAKLLVFNARGRRTFCLGFTENPPSVDVYRHNQVVPDKDHEYVGLGQIRKAQFDDGREVVFRILRVGKS